jgi:hypothetical protein
MRTPINKEALQNERILKRLERSHDKQGDPFRRYNQDMRDVTMLLRRGAIDYSHAEILRDQINDTFKRDKEKARLARKGKPTASDSKAALWFVGLVILFWVIYLY